MPEYTGEQARRITMGLANNYRPNHRPMSERDFRRALGLDQSESVRLIKAIESIAASLAELSPDAVRAPEPQPARRQHQPRSPQPTRTKYAGVERFE